MSGIRRSLCLLAIIATLLSNAACASSTPLALPLSAQGNIQLPADKSKPLYDLLTVDVRRGVLYVAHTSSSALEVIDTKSRKLVASIHGLASIKAVTLTPDPNVVFASMNTGGAVAVVDTNAQKILGTVPVSGAPDAIGYDPVHDLVVVTTTGSNELTAIDRTARKVTGTVKLPGAPELLDMDPKGGLAYVAINDKNEVAVVDLANLQVTELRGCDINAPTGIALDVEHGHLFVADRGLVSVIDVLLDKCLGSVDIGSGVDQIALNPHRGHLYTANGGSRNLSVIDTATFKPLGEVGTGPSGDGVAVDPTTDTVYVIVGRAGIVAVYHDP